MSEKTVLSTLYGIPKEVLSAEVLASHRKTLTAQQPDWYDSNKSTTYALFQEDEHYFWVPRFYGLEKWGVPRFVRLSAGTPLAPDVVFEGKLDETRQQITAYQAIVHAFRTHPGGGGMLCLPCGFGKTVVSIACALQGVREVRGHAVKTLVLLHKDDSMEQWAERIREYAPKARIGMIQSQKCEIDTSDIVLGMVQSLASRAYPGLDQFGLVIVDEGHHMAAPFFSKALFKLRPAYLLCLTATPKRSDGLQWVLHMFMGPILLQKQREITGKERVRMIRYEDPSQKEILTKNKKPLIAIMHKRMRMDRRRNRMLVQVILEYYGEPLRQIIVFSQQVPHLEELQRLLLEQGVKDQEIGFFHGKTKKAERAVSKSCRILLATIHMGREALDIRTLNTLVFALPVGKVEQAVGRILRDVAAYTAKDPTVPMPTIVDIHDPFSLFHGMTYGRLRYYRSQQYVITQEDFEPEAKKSS